MLIKWVFLFLVFTAPLAHAATYFVAVSGGSDANTCTQALSASKPKATIPAGITCAASGDTVTVADGTYAALVVSKSGSSGNPLTIKSTNKWGAVITMPSVANGSNDGVSIFSRTDVVIDGFWVSGSGGTQTTVGANTGINIQNSSRITVQRVKITGISRTICSNSDNGSGGVYSERNQTVTFDSMVVGDIGRLLHNESGCSVSGQHNKDHGFYIKGGDSPGSSNITIKNSIIYNSCRGWPIHVFDENPPGPGVNGLNLLNNTTADSCTQNGIAINAGHYELAHVIINGTFTNNLCYNPIGVCFSWSTAPTLTNVVANRNMATVATADIVETPLPSGITLGTGSNANIGGVTGSLLFTNPSLRDYTLKTGSPAINMGVTLSSVTTDFEGTARPQDGIYDIGADEVGVASPDVTPPAAPTGLTVQ